MCRSPPEFSLFVYVTNTVSVFRVAFSDETRYFNFIAKIGFDAGQKGPLKVWDRKRVAQVIDNVRNGTNIMCHNLGEHRLQDVRDARPLLLFRPVLAGGVRGELRHPPRPQPLGGDYSWYSCGLH